jgi:hypothetical protein
MQQMLSLFNSSNSVGMTGISLAATSTKSTDLVAGNPSFSSTIPNHNVHKEEAHPPFPDHALRSSFSS